MLTYFTTRRRGKSIVGMFIALLIMNLVLAHMLAYMQAKTAIEALMDGFWVWLGFIATVMFGGVLWEGTKTKLYTINVLHYLVILLVSSVIIVWM